MKRTWTITLIVVFAFAAYYAMDLYFREIRAVISSIASDRLLSYVLTYLVVGIPLIGGTMYIHRRISVLADLGLGPGIFRAIAMCFLFTVPMFLGGLLFFTFSRELTLYGVLVSALFAPFFEELYFRGFLFGQLFRYTRLGFIPSVLVGALLFASAHLYQSTDPGTLLGIFGMTFLGGVMFAWFYAEWKYNLWFPVFLHAFMNLSWALFAVSDHALGDLQANIGRVLTIALTITVTVIYRKRRHGGLEINRRTLWWKRETAG